MIMCVQWSCDMISELTRKHRRSRLAGQRLGWKDNHCQWWRGGKRSARSQRQWVLSLQADHEGGGAEILNVVDVECG